MQKFRFLIGYGLKKRIISKTFLISNFVMFAVILLISFLPKIINKSAKPTYIMAIQDKSNNKIVDILNDKNHFGKDYNKIVKLERHEENKPSLTKEDIYQILRNDPKIGGVLYFKNSDDVNNLKLEMYYKNDVSAEHIKHIKDLVEPIKAKINGTFEDLKINPTIDIMDDKGRNRGLAIFVALAVSLPIFFLLNISMQSIGTEIITEKESRAVETIMSSVPAKYHLSSKIISVFMFVLIQAILMLIFGVIAFYLSGGDKTLESFQTMGISVNFTTKIVGIVGFGLLSLLVGCATVLILISVIASLCNSQEDYQNFQAPLTILLVLVFYVVIFLIPYQKFDYILQILSYVPIFSIIVSPTAYASNLIAWWEVLISLGISTVFVFVLFILLTPIYHTAILSYDQSKFFQRIGNALKNTKFFQRKNKKEEK